jgi:hypothetical protein
VVCPVMRGRNRKAGNFPFPFNFQVLISKF